MDFPLDGVFVDIGLLNTVGLVGDLDQDMKTVNETLISAMNEAGMPTELPPDYVPAFPLYDDGPQPHGLDLMDVGSDTESSCSSAMEEEGAGPSDPGYDADVDDESSIADASDVGSIVEGAMQPANVTRFVEAFEGLVPGTREYLALEMEKALHELATNREQMEDVTNTYNHLVQCGQKAPSAELVEEVLRYEQILMERMDMDTEIKHRQWLIQSDMVQLFEKETGYCMDL